MCRFLQQLESQTAIGNEDINALNQEIVKLTGQIHAVDRLHVKGFLEPAAYKEKHNELSVQLIAARERRERFLSDQAQDRSLPLTEELMEIIENAPENLASLEDGEVFSMMVDKVIIDHNKKIVFRLINGLELIGEEGV
jgi:hypothetical protein